MAELALTQGNEVWTLTRGVHPLPEGVKSLRADRGEDESVRAALADANICWDACIDCTGRTPESARQDVQIISRYTERFIIVSTDSVYDPFHKDVPQNETNEHYLTDDGYGATKRRMEEVFLREGSGLRWTIFRPGHIFGPGFQLGCYPEHTRQPELLAHIRAGKALRLVGGGTFLIHPVYVDDLALAMLDAIGKERTFGQVYCIGSPDVVTNAEYYAIVGRLIGCGVTVEEVPLAGYLDAHPQYSGHLCHRCYDLTKLREAGVRMPEMPLAEGLRRQIAWLEGQV